MLEVPSEVDETWQNLKLVNELFNLKTYTNNKKPMMLDPNLDPERETPHLLQNCEKLFTDCSEKTMI